MSAIQHRSTPANESRVESFQLFSSYLTLIWLCKFICRAEFSICCAVCNKKFNLNCLFRTVALFATHIFLHRSLMHSTVAAKKHEKMPKGIVKHSHILYVSLEIGEHSTSFWFKPWFVGNCIFTATMVKRYSGSATSRFHSHLVRLLWKQKENALQTIELNV